MPTYDNFKDTPRFYADDFGPSQIMDYVTQFAQMKNAKDANERADRMALLQEAQMKYGMKVAQDKELSENYFNKYTSTGFDYDNLYADPEKTFGNKLPNPGEAFKMYQRDMASIGKTANQKVFMDGWANNSLSYVNQQLGKFNALRDQYRDQFAQEGISVTDNQLNAIMKDKGADQLLQNARAIYGYHGSQFNNSNMEGSLMNYEGIQAPERGFFERVFGSEPDVTLDGKTYESDGSTSGMTGGEVATLGALGSGYIWAHGATESQIREGAENFKKLAEKFSGPKPKGASPADFWDKDKFIKEVGMNKKSFKNLSAEEVLKLARQKGWSKTTLAKAFGYAQKNPAQILKSVGGLAMYAAPEVGKALDEALGTDDKFQTAGTAGLLYKMIPSSQKQGFFKFLAKKLPSTLAKQATKAAARHTASAATGIGAHPFVQGAMVLGDIAMAGYSIYDLYNEYQKEG